VRVAAHVTDLADPAAALAAGTAIAAEHPDTTLLINNAGIALAGRFDQVDAEQFDAVMAVNFHAVVTMTRALLPVLTAHPGSHLVNLSSVFGLLAPAGQTAYCASKFAVRGFSESLRHELEATDSPVGVTVVHPGGVRTRIAEQARAPKNAPPDEVARQRGVWRALLTLAPEDAAERIVRAIERRERRVVVGRDAQQAAWVQRLFPVGYWKIMARDLARRARRAGVPLS